MSRRPFPQYPHKPHSSGQARIKVRGRPIYLGLFRSKASYRRYQEELDRWTREPEGDVPRAATAARVKTVAQLVARFLTEGAADYRKADGTMKREWSAFPAALRPLLALHGKTPVEDFRAKALRQVQEAMASGSWMTAEQRAANVKLKKATNWCKRVCDRNLIRIRTVFRWAEREELIPEGRWHNLCTIRSIDPARARVNGKVLPVPEQDLAKTLPELRGVVRAAVELQLLTGGRPSEILGLRPGDFQRRDQVELDEGFTLDTRGLWLVELVQHKTQHHGHRRFLFFGPKAQEILAPFLAGRGDDVPLFSPREAAVQFLQEAPKNATRRKGSQAPKQAGRRIHFGRGRQPGSTYCVDAYARAIRQACDRAGVRRWTPYRLRHNAAFRLVKEFGWDVARIILGHSSVAMTRTYSPDDLEKAVEVVRKTG